MGTTPGTSMGILPPGKSLDCQLGHSVVNLSNCLLSKSQVEVLQKGLTFCPTPTTPDIVKIWYDLDDFFRCLRLKRHFFESDNDPERTPNPFKNKSNWSSPTNDHILECYIKTVRTEILLSQCKKTNNFNLTKKQIQAIKQLSQNPEIII